MKIQVKLDEDKNIGLLVDSEPFLLLENEKTEIEFVAESAKNRLLLVTARNGEAQKQFIVKNNLLILPQEFVKEGELDIVVNLYTGTNAGRKWLCEPMRIIKASKQGFEAYSKLSAELAKINIEIQECNATLSAIEKSCNFKMLAMEQRFVEMNKTFQKQINELWQTQEQ